jgi:hypothetical protein
MRVAIGSWVMVVVLGGLAVSTLTAGDAAQAAGQYQVVKVCSLLTVAEVKKLAPWEPMFDQMKIEEEGFGGGSSCSYPTATVQVMQFRQATIDAMGKDAKLEAVAGVGEAAWLRNNRNMFAELAAKVGPHLLTVQTSIDRGKTFETSKPQLLELGKAFAAKLR